MGETKIDAQSWILLLVLSLIWGGSFLFIAIAVKELPALLIVLARVGIAAAILIPVHLLVLGKLVLIFTLLVVVICALASVVAIRAALRVDPAAAIGG